jgi:hypothetical protein
MRIQRSPNRSTDSAGKLIFAPRALAGSAAFPTLEWQRSDTARRMLDGNGNDRGLQTAGIFDVGQFEI